MKVLINKIGLILAIYVCLSVNAYAGLDEAALSIGEQVGRYNVIRNGMCKKYPTPYMNKYVNDSEKLISGGSWYSKSQFKEGKTQGSAQFSFVINRLKKKDPDSFKDQANLKKQCADMDKDAKTMYEQLAQTGVFN